MIRSFRRLPSTWPIDLGLILALLALAGYTAYEGAHPSPELRQEQQRATVTQFYFGAEDAAAFAELMTERGQATCVAPTDDGRWAAYRC